MSEAELLAEIDDMLDRVTSGSLFDDAAFAQTPVTRRRLNDIAFAGDGEPTTYRNFDEIIAGDSVKKAWAATDQHAYSKADRTPERGDQILRAETKRWSALVRENNIKAE